MSGRNIFRQLHLELDTVLEEMREPGPETAEQFGQEQDAVNAQVEESQTGPTDIPEIYTGNGYEPPKNSGRVTDRSWYMQVYGGEPDPRMGQRFTLPDRGPKCNSRV